MAGTKIPKTAAALRKTSALTFNPVTLPKGATYQFTEADWARFAGKIRCPKGGCWVWMGTRLPSGYGQFSLRRRYLYPHRITYMLFVGNIPEGLHIDHLCRNRACCNPAHLEPVTCAENVRRSPIHPAAINAQKTECIRGHPLSGDNLELTTGGRRCRTCSRASWVKWYAKSKTAGRAGNGAPAPLDGALAWRSRTPEQRRAYLTEHREEAIEYGIPAGLVDLLIAEAEDADRPEGCERCGGDPCSECGECPRQGCWECTCDRWDRDDEHDDERGGEDDD